MSYITVFLWPEYLRAGPNASVLRLVQVVDGRHAIYYRDAGGWPLTVEVDAQGQVTTLHNTYTRFDGVEGVLCSKGVEMLEATWDEHKADNGEYARPCDCERLSEF